MRAAIRIAGAERETSETRQRLELTLVELAEAHARLQQQATELQQQVEEAQALATELEQSNEQLQEVNADAEAARHEVETLNRIGNTLASELDVERIVQTVTEAATNLTGAQFGAFFYNVVDAQGGKLTLYSLSGAPREAFEHFGHPRPTPVFAPTFYGDGDRPQRRHHARIRATARCRRTMACRQAICRCGAISPSRWCHVPGT